MIAAWVYSDASRLYGRYCAGQAPGRGSGTTSAQVKLAVNAFQQATEGCCLGKLLTQTAISLDEAAPNGYLFSMRHQQDIRQNGFTLIELSIVLVVIGLLVGGVLVGRDLISATQVRAQISQIDKYQQAVNTFKGKYGYLPGDIPDPDASRFGFVARRTGCFATARGDGNGVIEGARFAGCLTSNGGSLFEGQGETVVFWVDLSFAGLIDQTFTAATNTSDPPVDPLTSLSSPNLDAYYPKATTRQNSYVYVWSGGIVCSAKWTCSNNYDSTNYFGLSGITQSSLGSGLASFSSLTVKQAYAIDQKVDDSLPQTGRVSAMINNSGNVRWAPAGFGVSQGYTAVGASDTCYDNDGNAANPMQYSIAQNNGTGMNCALSFKMQ